VTGKKATAAQNKHPWLTAMFGYGSGQPGWDLNSDPTKKSPQQTRTEAARAEAIRVAKKTGGNADLIFAQWQHETNGFTNRGATELNNFAGVNVPGGKGQDYRQFDSLDKFGDYFAYPNNCLASTRPNGLGFLPAPSLRMLC
jgi:hypothetical protein